MNKHRIAPDVKEQIINRIKNEGVTVAEDAKEHGVFENTIKMLPAQCAKISAAAYNS